MFILKKGHQPGVYAPLRALFLVFIYWDCKILSVTATFHKTKRGVLDCDIQNPSEIPAPH